MPLVVGHALLGAIVVAAVGERGATDNGTWKRQLWIGAGLAVLPDLDLFLTWILGLGIKWHGGFTHSVLVATGVALVVVRMTTRRAFDVLVLTLAMASHGILDTITKKTYGGTELFWPIYSERLKLGLFDYFAFYPDSRLDPIWKLILRALQISIYELLLFGAVLMAILFIRRKPGARKRNSTDTTAGALPTSGKEISLGPEAE